MVNHIFFKGIFCFIFCLHSLFAQQTEKKFDEIVALDFDISEVRKNNKMGLMRTSTKEIIIPIEYDMYGNMWGFTNKCPVGSLQKDNKVALVNQKGKIITAFEYDEINLLNYKAGRLVVKKQNKMGIIDAFTGKVIMPVAYDNIYYEFEKNKIIVQKNDKWGIFNLQIEKEILPCLYQNISWQDADVAKAIDDKNNLKIFKIDDKATNLFEYNLGDAYCLSYPYFFIQKNNQWSFVKLGKKPSKHQYDQVKINQNNAESFFKVQKGNFWGIMSSKGEIIFEPIFTNVDNYIGEDGYAIFEIGKEKALVNMNKKIILRGEYDFMTFGGENEISILYQKNEKFGVLSLENKEILPAKYDQIGEHKNIWYGIRTFNILYQNGKIAFANQKGNVFTPFQYDNCGCWYDNSEVGWLLYKASYFGLFAVEKDKKWGIIDNKGNIVLPFEYDRIECPNQYKKLNDDTSKIEKDKKIFTFDWQRKKILEE